MASSQAGPSGALVLLLLAFAFECINFALAAPDGIGMAILQAILAGALALAVAAIWNVIAGWPTIGKDPKGI
jgi:hypothetical protein